MGLAVLLFGASGAFNELQSALNTIWGVSPKPGRGFAGLVRDRFFSFAMVLAVAFLLMASLVISAGLEAAGKFFAQYLPGGAGIWLLANFLISLAATTFLFGLIFKVVPEAAIAWRDVLVGATVTAVLFALGKWGLGFYIGRSGVTSSFGAAGSLVALVVWIYYSSQIIFLGAEFTQVFARRFGDRIRPDKDAVSGRRRPGRRRPRPERGPSSGALARPSAYARRRELFGFAGPPQRDPSEETGHVRSDLHVARQRELHVLRVAAPEVNAVRIPDGIDLRDGISDDVPVPLLSLLLTSRRASPRNSSYVYWRNG